MLLCGMDTLEQIVMNYKQANLAQDEHRDCSGT